MSRYYFFRAETTYSNLFKTNPFGIEDCIAEYEEDLLYGYIKLKYLTFIDDLALHINEVKELKNIFKENFYEEHNIISNKTEKRIFYDIIYNSREDNGTDEDNELNYIIEELHERQIPYKLKMKYPKTYIKYQLFIESIINDIKKLEYLTTYSQKY